MVFRNNPISMKVSATYKNVKSFFRHTTANDVGFFICCMIVLTTVISVIALPAVNSYYGSKYERNTPIADIVGIDNMIFTKNDKKHIELRIIGYNYEYSQYPIVQTVASDINQIFLVNDRITHVFTNNYRYTIMGYYSGVIDEYLEILTNKENGKEYVCKNGQCSSIIEKIKIRS